VTAIDRRLTEKDPLMIELTEEQLESAKHGEPLRFHAVEAEFVVLRAEIYDRIKSLLAGEDFQPSAAYEAIDREFAEGWEDPTMDDYDRYEERKQ